MKAIETVYKGYRFRSRLEARWAVFFDAAGIKYLYEPEGFEMEDGTKYLPDFYLPDMNTFFEVKGVMDRVDEHKIESLLKESGKYVAIGYDEMEFQASNDWWGEGITLTDKESSRLVQCKFCGKPYFMGLDGSFECRCCGEYDGDHGFSGLLCGCNRWPYRGNDQNKYMPLLKAKQARFEHDEKEINAYK